MDYFIRKMQFEEIQLIGHFPPDDWHLDIVSKFQSLYGKINFTPFVVGSESKIVGIASVIINGKVGWLGNIIVLPNFRNKGIGYSITEFLMKFLNGRGCESLLLIATKEGKNLYKKIGFKSECEYEFFSQKSFSISNSNEVIRKANNTDLQKILRLDKYYSGEDRGQIIREYFNNCLVYSTKQNLVEGYYIRDFGEGIVVASNTEAGIELLKLKLCKKPHVVIAEKNIAVKSFLLKNNYQKYSSATRMVFGTPVNWHPEGIYCRAAGDTG